MDSLSPSPKFLDMDLKVTHVECHPKEVLVTFQGKYNTEHDFDYHILQKEIQHVSKVKASIGIGEFCLVEDINGEWHRGRVLEKREEIYEVFLIDIGKVLIVNEINISSVCGEWFQLPPKVVYGVFANILPVGEKWGPKALNYFSSLIGLQIKGHVQAILPYQLFLMEVPKVTSDVLELQLGKLVDGDSFRLIVEMLKELPQELLCKQMPDLLQQKYTRPESSSFSNAENIPAFQPVLDRFLPSLSVGSVEKVKITVAISPSKFYCQMLKWQKGLEDLTTTMTLHYEAVSRENVPSCDSFGALCAAKRQKGQWHRGVIQQLLSDDQVKVWFMDFGNSEVVPSNHVLKLQQEFTSLPMISFQCALSCFSDQSEAVKRNSQLKEFKQALLGQTAVYASIDLFNANERLYYVTLHSQKSEVNAKYPQQVNEVVEACSLVSSTNGTNILGDINAYEEICVSVESSIGNTEQKGNCLLEKDPSLSIYFKTVQMKIDSVHVAFVEYVLNPSNFWIQTNDYNNEFQTLMKNIADVYNRYGVYDKIVENPKPGLLCCARYSKDMEYYRGLITEVEGVNINVYFLDFGNTDTVPVHDVKTLLPEFCKLPALAMHCALAHAFPIQDVWVKKETDFFKKVVFDKQLLLYVIAKQNDKYIVNAQFMDGLEQMDVVTLMVQAGYAEYWEVQLDSLLNFVKNSKGLNSKNKNTKYINTRGTYVIPKSKVSATRNICQNKQLLNTFSVARESLESFPNWESTLSRKHYIISGRSDHMSSYKELMFKPGAVLDVICSLIISPSHFFCQLQSKLSELMNLMEQIQSYYEVHSNPYKTGQIACVAKHSKDGKWYRAAFLKQVSRNEVDVIFVDYGNQERVLLKDLQAILPDFLTLESQAFTCSLKNLNEPSQFYPFICTKEACKDFGDFISASSGLLTCVIYALILIRPNCLCNLVDLQTPFIGAQQFLIEHGHGQSQFFGFTKELQPSVFLYSFCYSSFNIKIGSEEEVYITHIDSPAKFYCQLYRNTEIIDKLMKKIAEISNIPNSSEYDPSKIRLCIAKYFEDGLFYRAFASSMGSSSYLLAYFVDFGNKQMVMRDKLMPIPDHATDLLLTPMQAIKCYLSDLREREIPVEVNKWFEENFMGKPLKAVVVSRESDGQIGVELYDGHIQINQKILQLLSENGKKCTEELEHVKSCTEQSVENSKEVHKVKPDDGNKTKDKNIERIALKTEIKPQVHDISFQTGVQEYFEDKEQTVLVPQKLCNMPFILPTFHGNKEPVCKNVMNISLERKEKNADGIFTPESLLCPVFNLQEIPANIMTESCTNKLNYAGQQEGRVNRPKYINLPPRNIELNSQLAGYISNINSPSSFYIQLAEDENIIIQLAEELNEGKINVDRENYLNELVAGDLVLAEYVIDCFLYRAVIKTVRSGKSYEVEFIDYGNTAVVSPSKIYKIQGKFLTLPRFSIHCFLSRVKSTHPDGRWSSNVMFYFSRKVNNKQITCVFLQQHEQQWEVDIICDGKSVVNELMQRHDSSGLQNTPMLNMETNTEQDIPVTNADPEDEELRKNSRGHNKYEAVETRNTSEILSQIPNQDLNPGQLEMAEIIHISKCGNFHVKLMRNVQTFLDLNVMVAKEAKRNRLIAVENIQEGLECLTKSKNTLKWYRSKVMKLVSEEKMLVFFMDRGRREMVSLRNTKMLSNEIKCIPKQAILCKWIWIQNSGKMSCDYVINKIAHHEIKLLFLRYLESSCIWEVDILVDGILLLEYLNQISGQGKINKPNCTESANNVASKTSILSFRINSVTWALLQSGNQYPGFATTVTDPSNFCIQLEVLFDTMKTLFMLLSDLPGNLPTLPWDLVTPGASCLFKFGLEAQWNRVEVSEISDQSVVLMFIDHGFPAYIPYSDIDKLKVVPEELICLPRLSYSCSLSGVIPAKGEHWSDEAKLLFQEFLCKQGLIFQFKQYGSGMKLEVDVLCERSNLADTLVAAGHAIYCKRTCCLLGLDHTKPIEPCSQLQSEAQQSRFLQISEPKNSCTESSFLTGKKENAQQQTPDLQHRNARGTVSRSNSTTKPPSRKRPRKKPSSYSNGKNTAKDELKCDKNLFMQFSDKKCNIISTESLTENLPPEAMNETCDSADMNTRMREMKISKEVASK
ncbi:Tudor domain-containing protein 15 [Platysternon megacephalum]|uniref:Tudor domain-containing protein 15 n=1 Tax=Platysternon megacephalum TaxID=55544 RepID=A0A4D9DPP3_9SAUR|nr:Tudor domain-containing protein 15 [Platysternon megacephalum]